MEFINYKNLDYLKNEIKQRFMAQHPFRYIVIENFFKHNTVDIVYNVYPKIDTDYWNGTTYINQKNKFQKTTFEKENPINNVFKELNSEKFINWLQEITEIETSLTGDDDLFGGGLHQSVTGAFLNVHVDYNIHPKTKFHRRLNVLIYMNKNWEESYEGHLELWDLTGPKKVLLDKIAPTFNRCVIFETNEISFHGHPKPLKTPPGVSRKSIATYYYSKTRPAHEIVDTHNTIYVNTEGINGEVRKFNAGIKAFLERINKK